VLPLLEGREDREGRVGREMPREALIKVAAHARRELRAWDAALGVLPGVDLRLERGGFSVARSILREYDKALSGQVLRAAARRAGLRLGPGMAEQVAQFAGSAKSGRRLDAGCGQIAEVAFDRLVVYRQTPAPGPRPLAAAEGAAQFGGFSISWRPDTAPERLEREAWTTWIAPDELAVRAPNPGDRLVPLRGTGHREVTRLLMEARVARGERGAWPVVVRNDQPVWIPGVCRAEAALPAPGHGAVRVDVTAG
jgi:tRNA(Ile)-lysidine synthase